MSYAIIGSHITPWFVVYRRLGVFKTIFKETLFWTDLVDNQIYQGNTASPKTYLKYNLILFTYIYKFSK